MNWFGLVRGMLLLFALAGLLLAPLSAAMPKPAMSAQAMAAMADDVPCPDQKNSKTPCAQDCPALGSCVTGLGSPAILASVRINFEPFIGTVLVPDKAFAFGSLPGEPPARPPRA